MDNEKFDLNKDAIMHPYRTELASYCSSFTCGDSDLDDFFAKDAYNNPNTLHFYEKNGFKPLYKTEQEEREFFNLESNQPLHTRFYYFDLKW